MANTASAAAVAAEGTPRRASALAASERFARPDDSRSRETGGIGLGLSIALFIVQAQGGQLTLSNRPEGGLRASITLPIQPGRPIA